MSSKLVLGFLGGLLVATALITALDYLQLHRNTTAAAETAETAVIVTPPAPFPETSVPAAQPAPVKAPKTKVAPAKPAALKQAKVQQAKVEAPSVRKSPSIAVPAPVAVLAAQPAPVKAPKTKVAPAKPAALKQAKVQQAKVEAPSVRKSPSIAVPAPVAVLAAQPAPVKAPKTKVAPAKPAALKQAKVQQAKVEAPSVRKSPSVAVPAPVAVLAAPPPQVQVDITPISAPVPSQPRSVTIASGTLVTVRLGKTVSTERNQPGDTFVATLDQPLVVDGLVIAEKGARATGHVVDSVEAGRVNGLALLSLELTNLMTSDGQNISLRTARFSKFGIGAAVGGAPGGGVAVTTRGRPSMLPAATKISFCVEQPVTITETR